MKKVLLLFISVLLTFQIFGKEVTIKQAKDVARLFLLRNPNSGLKSTSQIILNDVGDVFNTNINVPGIFKSATTNKPKEIFVFNVDENNGFIIVSGDDAAIPILAYSNSGSIDSEKVPQNVMKWIEGYKQQIQFIKKNNIEQTETIKNQWNGITVSLKSTQSSVSPLITTKWDQSPNVNAKCPYDYTYQELTVTGCPATAMAQIMKYWEYPAKGSGFHSYQHNTYGTLSANFGSTYYDWDEMPDLITGPNDAVATLMYDCGVAVEMVYGVKVSGSYVIKDESIFGYSDKRTVEYALPAYFGYASTIKGLERIDYSDQEWKEILKTELTEGRPVQYAGFGQGGHTFVCDGFDENNMFHMNWGWGGKYDAFFLLDNLSPGTGGAGAGAGMFNSDQQALIGIKPPDASQTYELEIYSDVVTTKSTISYGEGFSISTNILNDGTNAFNGDYGAAIFDENDVFVDFVEIKKDWNLAPNYYYNDGINFSTEGLLSLLPGKYSVSIFYRPNEGNWNFISTDFWDIVTSDYVEIEVTNDNIISLYSSINVLTDNVYSGDSLSVWLDIGNYSDEDFEGVFDVSLYSLEGNFISVVETKTNMSLTAQSHYENGLTFSIENINVEPGTYYLAMLHKWDGYDYELTGSTSSFINPVKIIVQKAPYLKDIYEDNDLINSSFVFNQNYIDEDATVLTTGSNIHVGSDWDFYSVELEGGFNYQIDLRLHDAYSSGNGNSYSVDALFLYSLDGENWSDSFDDIMPSVISTSGNKTLYCIVSPYFLGETGTYLFEMNIQRSVATATNDIENTSDFYVYPNPCSETLKLRGTQQFLSYKISDINGRTIKSDNIESRSFDIDVSALNAGLYFVEVKTANEMFVKKIVKR